MIPIWFAVPYILTSIYKSNKAKKNMANARANYKAVDNKRKHHRLDVWCESWLAGNLPNDALLEKFEKRKDGHWYRKEDKGNKE